MRAAAPIRISLRCLYCGHAKPHVKVIGGKAHRKCIPKRKLRP